MERVQQALITTNNTTHSPEIQPQQTTNNRTEWQQRGIPHEHNILRISATNNENVGNQRTDNRRTSDVSPHQVTTNRRQRTETNVNVSAQ